MRIERAPEMEAWFLQQCRESFAKGDEERHKSIHLTDVMKPRLAWWARVDPKPLDDRDILYFVAGRGHEDIIGRLSGLTVSEPRVIEGISMRPDFRWFGLPAEFKTRRANLAEPGEELVVYENYLDQLARGYCALENETTGILVVLSLLEGRNAADPKRPTEPAFRVYKVTITPEELAVERRLLIERREGLEQALTAWDTLGKPAKPTTGWEALPLCAKWMCSKRLKVVDKPGHCDECDTDFTAARYAEGHTKTKVGKRHHVTPEVSHWTVQPRCKWFTSCKPWEVDPDRGP